MRKKICFSRVDIEAFYEGQIDGVCDDLGDFYACNLQAMNLTPADGECEFCKRITDFAKEIGILGDSSR